jgi:hypothetical protein
MTLVFDATSQPGIRRDGTTLDGHQYTDGQWCRFQRGRPRKIGGYRVINPYMDSIIRGLYVQNASGVQYIYGGHQAGLDALTVDNNGNSSAVTSRTPTSNAVSYQSLTANANGVNALGGPLPPITAATATGGNPNLGTITFATALTQGIGTQFNVLLAGFVNSIVSGSTTWWNGYATLTVITTTTAQLNLTTLGAPSSLSGAPTTLGTITQVTPNLQWQFDVIYDTVNFLGLGAGNYLVAHAAPNATDPTSTAVGPIYAGPVYGSGALYPIVGANIPVSAAGVSGFSGGILALPPFLTAFGNDGLWACSNTTGTGTGQYQPSPFSFCASNSGSNSLLTSITRQKIVAGRPLRGGGGNSPAALYWSLDSLIRGTFVGGTTVFSFDTLSSNISVMSAASIIDYDGTFLWLAQDRFMMFNGVVAELPNPFSQNWLFDNINRAYSGKCFAFKVPRFAEVWWCYPRGNATECSHAVIYNVRDQVWYDTPLPEGGRSSGFFSAGYLGPIMTGTQLNTFNSGANQSNLFQHEYGKDALYGPQSAAVLSYFTTAQFTPFDASPASEESQSITRVEPDFVQTGDMQMNILTQANAKAPQQVMGPYTVTSSIDTTSQSQTIPLSTSGRLISFQFVSSTLNGDYQCGRIIAHSEPFGERLTF